MKIYTNKILVLIITVLSLSLSAIEDMSMELDLVPVDEPGGECDAWLLSVYENFKGELQINFFKILLFFGIY